MSKNGSQLQKVVKFFSLHSAKPRSWFLAFEGLLVGGLHWRIKANMSERRLKRATDGKFEASGSEYESRYRDWLSDVDRATYGKELSSAAEKHAVLKLGDAGIPAPKIRTWLINGHIDEDGNVVRRGDNALFRLVAALGWTWHLIVIVSAFLFLVYAWSLPGPIWKKVIMSIVEIMFFGVMSGLMNSTSLSAIPPTEDQIQNI